MGYTSKGWPKRGEICLKGSSIQQDYFLADKGTTDQQDMVDGWIHTGDIAEIDQNGKIQIIDRVKNIFKLSNGEYIAPEKIENVFIKSDWVVQCWMYGDSL